MEKERLEKERIEKERLEKEHQEKERLEKERTEREMIGRTPEHPLTTIEHKHPIITNNNAFVNNTSPPPGINVPINNSPEARQQVLIDALVGSTMPMDTTPIRPPPPQLPHVPFMPPHMPPPPSTSLLNNPVDHTSPLNGPIFNARPLEPSTSTRRSITSIAPIGQPVTGRRPSSIPLDTNTDPLLAASNIIKGTEQQPRSFFSSFLFGPNNTTNIPDPRFRRFSTDQTNNWTNGWTATSVLSENVHGKLFGDALVRNNPFYFIFFYKELIFFLKKKSLIVLR